MVAFAVLARSIPTVLTMFTQILISQALGSFCIMVVWQMPRPVNRGSGEEVSIKKLVETVEWLPEMQRAETFFRFRAETDLETGLAHTVAWYREQIAVTA